MKAERVITTIDNGLMVTIAIRGGVTHGYASRETPGGHYEHIGTFFALDSAAEAVFVPDGKVTPPPTEEESKKAATNYEMLAGALKTKP